MKVKRFCLSLAYLLLNLLSYPPFNLGGLAFIAYIPLLFLIDSGISLFYYFWLTLSFNLLYFVWLVHTNIPGWLLLSLLFTLFSLPGFFLIRFFLKRGWLFFLSVLLVVFEYLRVVSDYMLPFQIIGYTQWNVPLVLLLARYGGVWVVSWFVYSANLIIFNCLKKRRLRLVWFLGLLLLLVPAGHIRTIKPARLLRVALIQTNLRLDGKSVDDNVFWNTYTQASLAAAAQKPDVYIWPEVVLVKSLREDRESARRLKELLTKLNAGVILGNRDSKTFDLRFNNNYNAVFYIDKNGVVQGTHYKQKLIPFMETINSDLALLPYFVRNKFEAGVYRRGEDRNLFTLAPRVKIAPLICFEAVNGTYVREFVRQNPGFIVNVSSDGWSRSLTEHQLNLYFNVFRAVESGLYVVRVAEDGISAVISPYGKIIESIPAFTSGNIVYDVPVLNVTKHFLF